MLHRRQEMTLVWLSRSGGMARISGGQISMCRTMADQGYCSVVKNRHGWKVQLLPKGEEKATELKARDEGKLR